MSADLPARLDRSAVERVLARAAELQSSLPAGTGEVLSEAQLIDVAREAGLSVEHVRAALVEERMRAATAPTVPETGLAGRIAGPAAAGASRVVALAPAVVLERMARVLEREECMVTVRRTADRATWELRRDLVGGVMRGLRGGTGLRALRSTEGVSVAVLPLEEGRTLVRVEAGLGAQRRQRLTVGGVVAGSGVLAAGTIAAVGAATNVMPEVLAPAALLPTAISAVAGWAVARSHRRDVARAQEALDRLLDRVESDPGAPPAPSLLEQLLGGGVRRALGERTLGEPPRGSAG